MNILSLGKISDQTLHHLLLAKYFQIAL